LETAGIRAFSPRRNRRSAPGGRGRIGRRRGRSAKA
jgi:hypothetical protein